MNLIQKIESSFQDTSKHLDFIFRKIKTVNIVSFKGKIQSANGTMITASMPMVNIGDLCLITEDRQNLQLHAEVVAIHGNEVKLLPFGGIENLSKDSIIEKVSASFSIPIGSFMLGKVINGLGEVIGSLINDDNNSSEGSRQYPIMQLAPDPLKRMLIEEPLLTGVKAIDLFITCGKGQRIAIFAGPGMGKTTLMSMIMRYTNAGVIVVALIGERGREVREFIELELDESIKWKCIVVVVTSDRPPVEQVKAAYIAQTIAEFFRDTGQDVLMFMDSVTRFARAQREVGLSAGEPMTRGGYPPSVYLAFPKLMERAGKNEIGSITAFYTVLMEGEATNQDPIADEIKSIVDGHIVLSKKLVEQGHFPAINILSSLSRIADRLISEEHKLAARKLRMLLSKYEELEFLIRVGEYQPGNDLTADEAVEKHTHIINLLRQSIKDKVEFPEMLDYLMELSE